MGIGNTTPATALIAATFGLAADDVVGRGTGVDDVRLAHKSAVITAPWTAWVTGSLTR